MQAQVNATRMELLRLRNRVGLASRGHRLLSEKRDEISRQLILISREIGPLRKEVESQLLQTSRRFMMARATMEPENIAAAKVALSIKGGFLSDTVLTVKDVEMLAKLPSREILLSQVVGGMQSPITAVVYCLASPIRSIIGGLQARIKQLEED